MNTKCPTCGVRITAQNAGGYRTYCENCVDAAESEEKARLLIEEVLERFESKPRGIPQAHVAAELAKELRAAIGGAGGIVAHRDRLISACQSALDGSVDARTYPDGPCLEKSIRDELRAAINPTP